MQNPPFSLHNVCLRGIILCDVPCGVKSSPMYLQTFHSSPAQHEPRRLSSLSLELLVEPENWPKESITEQTTVYKTAEILRVFCLRQPSYEQSYLVMQSTTYRILSLNRSQEICWNNLCSYRGKRTKFESEKITRIISTFDV